MPGGEAVVGSGYHLPYDCRYADGILVLLIKVSIFANIDKRKYEQGNGEDLREEK